MQFTSYWSVSVGLLYILVGCLSAYLGCLRVSAGLSGRSIQADLEEAEADLYPRAEPQILQLIDAEFCPATVPARKI